MKFFSQFFKRKLSEPSPVTGKVHFRVTILPECIERLKRDGSETIETRTAVVHLTWADSAQRTEKDFGDGCFVSEA
jgi:hypothetical protein